MYVFCFFLLNDIMLIDNLHDYARVILNKLAKTWQCGAVFTKISWKIRKKGEKTWKYYFFVLLLQT